MYLMIKESVYISEHLVIVSVIYRFCCSSMFHIVSTCTLPQHTLAWKLVVSYIVFPQECTMTYIALLPASPTKQHLAREAVVTSSTPQAVPAGQGHVPCWLRMTFYAIIHCYFVILCWGENGTIVMWLTLNSINRKVWRQVVRVLPISTKGAFKGIIARYSMEMKLGGLGQYGISP